jgi:hypothetical protein
MHGVDRQRPRGTFMKLRVRLSYIARQIGRSGRSLARFSRA